MANYSVIQCNDLDLENTLAFILIYCKLQKEHDIFSADTKSPEKDWEKWDVSQTCNWLSEIHIKPETIQCFRDEEINGKALRALTENQLKMMSVKMGEITLIVKQRNLLFHSVCVEENTDNTAPGNPPILERIDQKPCSFQKPLDPLCLYETDKFLPKPAHGGSLLDVRHHYVNLPRITVSCLERVAMEFASACLNSSTNATIHFGVRGGPPDEAGRITGLPLSGQLTHLDVASSVEKYLYKEQWSIAKECISSYRVVKVRKGTNNATKNNW